MTKRMIVLKSEKYAPKFGNIGCVILGRFFCFFSMLLSHVQFWSKVSYCYLQRLSYKVSNMKSAVFDHIFNKLTSLLL